MAPVNIPFLWINPGRRHPAAYYRRGSVVVRIRDAAGKPLLPGQPGFLAAFDAIRARFSAEPAQPAGAPPAPGSMSALIVAYRASPEWTAHAPRTREEYGRSLDRIGTVAGGKTVATMPRAFVFALRDRFAVDPDGTPTPRRANATVGVLRLLMAWAVNRGWRPDNPAISPGQLQTGPGLATWRPEEFRAFMDHPGVSEPLKRAAALGYYTGQRKADCLAITRDKRAGGGIEFVPEKTKRKVKDLKLWIPEDPELTRILDAAPHTDAVTLLTRPDGRPWLLSHFNHAFVAAVRLAGLPDGHGFHGLRKAATANLAESGATDAEIDAVVYHSDPKMTRLYRAGANQKRLAQSGMAKLKRGTT